MTNKFINKLESLFEQDEVFSQALFSKNNDYSIEPNHKFLEKINFDNSDQQWSIFFSRLTAFFEIGFYIEKNTIKNYFYFGDFFNNQNIKMNFNLPNSDLFHVLKTPGEAILKKLGLKKIPDAHKMTCLFIRLDNNTSILLVTSQADPWLKLRCESLKVSLLNHDYFQN